MSQMTDDRQATDDTLYQRCDRSYCRPIIDYNLRNSDYSYVLPQCKINVFKHSFINWCLFLCNCHLYLPLVYVCFIHVCCEILIKYDDDDDDDDD